MSVGGVFATAFSAFGARAGTLVPLVFLGSLPLTILHRSIGDGAEGVVLGFVLGAVVYSLLQSIAIETLRDLRERRPETSVGGLLRSALPVLPRMTAAAALLSLPLIAGPALLILPAFLAMTIWGLAPPVIAVEGRRVIEAFGRSRRLVRGTWWRVAAVVILLWLLSLLMGLLFFRIVGPHVDGDAARVLLGSLLSSILGPLEALVLGVLCFRLIEIEQSQPAGSVLQ